MFTIAEYNRIVYGLFYAYILQKAFFKHVIAKVNEL